MTFSTETLGYPHENASRVVLMQTPQIVDRLVQVIASLMMVARIVGESYDEIVGYTLGDMIIQKGEPYTQWRETATQLEKEKNSILLHLRQRPAMA